MFDCKTWLSVFLF